MAVLQPAPALLVLVPVLFAASLPHGDDGGRENTPAQAKDAVLVTLGLTFCILAEDVLMILIWQPNDSTDASLFPLYISERNFSENFLMLAFAFYSLRESATTLRLRFKEPPAAKSPTVLQHIDDLAPAYCARHGLTMREQEVLELVLQGKDNQNIASELQLALGTVKAHVHNILKKTGHPDRQALIQDFWRE